MANFWDAGPTTYMGVPITNPQQAQAQPADWTQYLAQGGNPSSRSAYQNFTNQNQRYSSISDFVKQQTDPNVGANTQMFANDYGTANTGLNNFLATSPSGIPNQFSGALKDDKSRITSLLDNPNSIQDSAAYKFRFNQGLDALNRQLGAKGLLNSGNRLIDTTNYGQDAASQEYDNQFKRLSDLYGTNANAYIGDQNANTNQWIAKGNLLKDYYGTASGNVLQNQQNTTANKLGWGQIGTNSGSRPQNPNYWGITNNW